MILRGAAPWRGRSPSWRGRSPPKGSVPSGGGRSLILSLLLAAVGAAPAALACEEAAESAVAANPDDREAQAALARACLGAGRAEEALAHYDALLARDAGNVDWLLGKSQALVALGRPREALPLLERGRALAPAYEDVWRLQVTALEESGESTRANALASQAGRAFPQAAWPAERRRAMAEKRLLERDTRLSLDASYENLSGGRPAWRGASVGIDRHPGGARRLFAGLHLEERFDRQDEQLTAGFADRIGEHWSVGASGDVAPDAEVLPEWSVVLEAGRALPGGRGLDLRARRASYATVDVDSVAAAIEQYLERFRVRYGLNAAKTSGIDGWSLGHAFRFARDYGRASHVSLVFGYGEEAETIAPGVVQVTDVRSVALHGVHWRSAAWGIAWEAGWVEQGDLYDRFRVRLGLERRF